MSILNSLYPGSWNGVPFLIEESSIGGGRKTVVHEFPNQDNRFVEDLGLLNETISLTVCVPSADYFSNRDSIKSALEFKGYGTLIHPFYGTRNAACTSYTIAEQTTDLGYVRIALILSVGQELNFPSTGANIAGNISGLTSAFFAAFRDVIADLFVQNPGYGRYSGDIATNMTNISTTFDKAALTYLTRTEFLSQNVSEYRAAFTDYTANTYKYLANRSSFADDTLNLAVAFDAITPTGASGFSAATLLTDFTLTPLPRTVVTPAQKYRDFMNTLILTFVQSIAFGLSCRNASLYDFGTIDIYDGVRAELDLQYMTLAQSFNDLSGKTDTSAVEVVTIARDAFEELRSETVDFLSKTSVTLPRVALVPGNNLPLSILTYTYYGSLDNVDFLQELNFPDQIDPSFLGVNVKILSGTE